jgi:hypothetical protein
MRNAGLAFSQSASAIVNALAKGAFAVIDDKVRIRCPSCSRIFRDRAQRVRDGYQVNCEHCSRLLTLNRDSEDPFIRRALKTAREIRAALEAVPVSTRMDASERSR